MRGEVVVPRGMKPDVAGSSGEAPGGMGTGMGVAGRRRVRVMRRERRRSIVLVRKRAVLGPERGEEGLCGYASETY